MPIETKFESTTQPGLFFWVEEVEGAVACFMVVSQAAGFPATEAWDDWFANAVDAQAIAQKLAQGEL